MTLCNFMKSTFINRSTGVRQSGLYSLSKEDAERSYSKQQSHTSYELEEFDELFMETIDSNEVLKFCAECDPNQANNETCDAIRIEFGKITELYGRIVMYSLEVWGFEG
ncbi:hypothetical protein ACHAWX_000174 [Stephanocyclus meneghinianus]